MLVEARRSAPPPLLCRRRTTNRKARRRARLAAHVLAALVLFAMLAALSPEIALQGRSSRRPTTFRPSYFGAAGAARQAGEFPLWNPYLFLGMPSFASLAYTPWVTPPSRSSPRSASCR